MSRKVYVSSDISSDDRLIDVAMENPQAALLWPWLLTALDDWGRCEASAKQLKARTFPMISSVTVADIDTALALFATNNLLEIYEVAGKRYIAIPHEKWFRYQTHIRAEKRDSDKSRYPAPPSAQLRAVARDDAQLQADVANCIPSPSPSPSPSMENVPTERGASAPPADASEPEKPGTNGHKPVLPPRRKSDTTDAAYWERVLKEAPDGQRLPLLVYLAHDKIGTEATNGGAAYGRIGMLAKKHGAALVAKWVLQAASEHIAGDPLDYLTALARKQTNRASQNGRKPANPEPNYARTGEDMAPIAPGWR